MIKIIKKASEVANFLKAKFNISSDALFSTAAFLGLAIIALSPDIAAAASTYAAGGTSTTVGSVVCNIVKELQGPIVRGVAAFAVIFLGFSLFLGKISWGTALALGIGVACVFGAEQIVGVMAGSDDNCTRADVSLGVGGTT